MCYNHVIACLPFASSTLSNNWWSCNVSCHVFLDLQTPAEDDWSRHYARSLPCCSSKFVYDSLYKQTRSKRWFKQTLVHVQLNKLDLFGRAMLARTGHLCIHMSSVYNLCPHISLGPDLQPETA